MNDHYIRAAVCTVAPTGGAMPENGAREGENRGNSATGATRETGEMSIAGISGEGVAVEGDRPVTVAELYRILHAVLSGLRVYVLEEDITSSQNAVRAIVEQSKF